MPFHWIESLLAISFTLVWLFIVTTLFGDRLWEVRQRRTATQKGPQGPHYSRKRSPSQRRRKQRASADRVAV